MEIKFLGAAECITGSCHLITVNNKKILLDCGLFLGGDEKTHDNSTFYFNPREIDYVILSHCHTDHSGRIPLLYKRGYEGKVYCTKPTVDLTAILLSDTYKILEEEVYFANLERQKMNMEALQPLYDERDIDKAITNFEGYGYNEKFNLCDGIDVVFHDAGHVLGSAISVITIRNEEGECRKLMYSGDLGNVNRSILNDPETGLECDYLIMESTYGNKVHQGKNNNYLKLLNIIRTTMTRGGNVVIPCFSLGRSQEIIYMLNRYVEGGAIKNCRVYVDSPLASSITEVFKKYEKYYDDEANMLLARGDNPLEFKGLHFVDGDMKKSIYDIKSGAVIIVSGGNVLRGRAGMHLKGCVSRKECAVVITSYKGRKSIGSRLLKGVRLVEIMGERIPVRASVYYLGGLSGHGDKEGLLRWLDSLKKKPEIVFLVHGEERTVRTFKYELMNRFYCVKIAKYLSKVYIKST